MRIQSEQGRRNNIFDFRGRISLNSTVVAINRPCKKEEAMEVHIREVLHSEFRNYFRNMAAAVEKVVELSEVWWRKCIVFRKWIFGSFMLGSAYLNTKKCIFHVCIFAFFSHDLYSGSTRRGPSPGLSKWVPYHLFLLFLHYLYHVHTISFRF